MLSGIDRSSAGLPSHSLFVVRIDQVVLLGIVDDDRPDLSTLENAPLPRSKVTGGGGLVRAVPRDKLQIPRLTLCSVGCFPWLFELCCLPFPD